MSRWLISVPVWNDVYRGTFLRAGLPSIEKAAVAIGGDVSIVLHTDQPDFLNGKTSLIVRVPRLPEGSDFVRLSSCHREVMAMANPGDRVMLLTADLMISQGALVHAESVFATQPKKIIMCAGIRAILGKTPPPTESAREMLDWAWDHRHPITEQSVYPHGRSVDLSRMYFTMGTTVVSRQVLPHPLAVVIDGRGLAFTPTIDSNLVQNFQASEIYVSTHPDELALVELSPEDKDFHLSEFTMQSRLDTGVLVSDVMQQFMFRHRIGIKGSLVDCGDEEIVERTIKHTDEVLARKWRGQ